MTHHTSVRFMSVYPALLLSYTCRAGSVPERSTILMRGVSAEQSQSTEREGEWSGARSAMANDNIQQLSTKDPEHT